MYDIIVSGKIADPLDGVYEGTVAIKGKAIAAVSGKKMDAKKEIILDESCMIFPGFIDPHVHLREPGWEYKENFATGSAAAINGGVVAVADMPNLPEPITSRERLYRKAKLAEKALISVLHYGGIGSNEDIKELSKIVPAFKIYAGETTGTSAASWRRVEEAIKLISKSGKPISFHCEDHGIIERRKKEINPAEPRAHCEIRSEEAEASAVENVIRLCKKHRAKGHIAHLSTGEALGMVAESEAITCEAAPHHLFFTKKDMRDNFLKMNPPLRSARSRNALIKGVKNGRIAMMATDHAPHTAEEKRSSSAPSGVPGLDTYGILASWLLLKHRVSPGTLARITSHNAARFLGIADMGRIKEGFRASLTVLDRKGRTTINRNALKTKCGWSPYEGLAFPGKIRMTMVDGKIMK